MESLTLGELLGLVPSLGPTGLLAVALWLWLVDRRVMLRADHVEAMAAQGEAHERELAERDRRIARLEREADGWRDIALRGTGLLEQAAPFLSSSSQPGEAQP